MKDLSRRLKEEAADGKMICGSLLFPSAAPASG
jgi:hypothetical protein